ncbi:DUF2628 domain-containing protein [Ensifer adhaerens]|uniref:DUF2628 domain-containing protein n=1 Tax=Ensifer adhaerens TaxID=106592 RepID=UPI001CBCB334|nr:DUF2628 domain-containing protein [Ensifer adhaerens]MBZ7923808.1 DUF2628 domain-containing protein [Ensifer adhaerens]UAX92350.1 DUF2628 domain-containing protein [Ensifer adhaerens]UAX99983.1 DUF2628 domain-containing protein [Ensifer adhaerens]UAY07367.1 DUF2628 domain-containing protein [Ensifer adhaerens]
MASYMILTPPGARADDERARFVADGFSWGAFLFPALWLLFKRQWVIGIAVAVLQISLISLSSLSGGFLASVLVQLALRLLVALEGPVLVARSLTARDWTLRSIVPAPNLAAAEEIYFTSVASSETRPTPPSPADWTARKPSGGGTGLGLFDSYGER